jgi:CelD/BcsL family acetyltransferase involved in cellulose biosynthesis
MNATLIHESNEAACERASATIEVVDPRLVAGWDSLIETRSDRSFFHSAAWANVLCDTYGFEPLHIVVRRGGEVVSVLPVMEVNSPLTGKRGVSLPFSDFCRPLGANPADLGEMLKAALELGRRRQWKYFECRGTDVRAAFPEAVPSCAYIEHIVELGDEEKAFKKLKTEVRTAIRRAGQNGISIKIDNTMDGVREFFRMHCECRQRHGVPPQPFQFFEHIWKHVLREGKGALHLALHEGTAVASAVFLHSGRQVIYKFGASDRRCQQLRANNHLFWEAIKTFSLQGYEAMNMGRTTVSDDGLRRFKRGWGAEETPLEYFRYDFRQSRFTTGKDDTEGWHTAVFRKLPIPVNRLLGRVLYRHMG